MEKNIQDKDLGVITLRTTPRATRYTLKISKGKITATMPPGGDEKRMIAFIMENKARLVKALQKYPARPLLDERSELQATTFRLHIFRTERSNFYMRLEDGVLHIRRGRGAILTEIHAGEGAPPRGETVVAGTYHAIGKATWIYVDRGENQ